MILWEHNGNAVISDLYTHITLQDVSKDEVLDNINEIFGDQSDLIYQDTSTWIA